MMHSYYIYIYFYSCEVAVINYFLKKGMISIVAAGTLIIYYS